jgi:FKBP-type peptidyl-prolyl cis-trans isomerase FklB
MKRLGLFALVLILLGTGACAQKNKSQKTDGPVNLTNKEDSVSYILGASLGKNISQAELENINTDLIMRGLQDGMESDSAMIISMNEGNNFMRTYMQEKQQEKAAKAEEEAKAYIEKLAEDEVYKSTTSGIIYQVIEEGDGEIPQATDKVKVHYEGTNMKGEIFDSSYERGQPAEFPLNRVIAGWTEILQKMPVGSTWKVVIPPSLAYGERGSPPKIGPNEVLTFKIELIDIVTEE